MANVCNFSIIHNYTALDGPLRRQEIGRRTALAYPSFTAVYQIGSSL